MFGGGRQHVKGLVLGFSGFRVEGHLGSCSITFSIFMYTWAQYTLKRLWGAGLGLRASRSFRFRVEACIGAIWGFCRA